MAEMKLRTLKVEKGLRWYEREDGTCWELVKEEELDCWSIYQLDPATAEVVYGDPRCGINDGIGFAPTLKGALWCLRENCNW